MGSGDSVGAVGSVDDAGSSGEDRPEPSRSSEPDEPQREPILRHVVLVGGRLPGGAPVSLEIRDGVIEQIGPQVEPSSVPRVDLEGGVVVPGFIDSHVHLAYHFGVDGIEDGQRQLASRGVVAGVDLAAPLAAMPRFDPKRWLSAGPMLTAPGGYPLDSWGAGGYGYEVSTPRQVREAIDMLADAGATVIKVPFHGELTLGEAALSALVEHAHGRGLRVVAHALGADGANRAADAGADALAHVPLEPLSAAAARRWKDRAVITTVMAFGGSPSAVDNLRRLHLAGATVLYGTDLGNRQTVGVDAAELVAMGDAGLDAAQILAAGTQEPAEFWGLEALGELAPGFAASFMVLDADPLDDPAALARPAVVYVDGVPSSPS